MREFTGAAATGFSSNVPAAGTSAPKAAAVQKPPPVAAKLNVQPVSSIQVNSPFYRGGRDGHQLIMIAYRVLCSRWTAALSKIVCESTSLGPSCSASSSLEPVIHFKYGATTTYASIHRYSSPHDASNNFFQHGHDRPNHGTTDSPCQQGRQAHNCNPDQTASPRDTASVKPAVYTWTCLGLHPCCRCHSSRLRPTSFSSGPDQNQVHRPTCSVSRRSVPTRCPWPANE